MYPKGTVLEELALEEDLEHCRELARLHSPLCWNFNDSTILPDSGELNSFLITPAIIIWHGNSQFWIEVMLLLDWIHPMTSCYQSKSYNVHTMCLLVTSVS